ncbi:MAG: ferredoxin--NADP reductase [Myxococcales bacterium]
MNAFKQFAARLFGRAAVPEEKPTPELRDVSAKPAWRSLRITRVVQETPDSRVLYLEDISGAPIEFESGQFLTLAVQLPNERLLRSYSICTAPHSGAVAVGVKRVQGGRASNYLNESAKVGDVLEARGPNGRFVLAPASQPRRVCLIAGGSGITPLLSHARHLLEREPDTSVAMIYGNRSESDVMFRGELERLWERYPERFVLRHVLSEPRGGISCTRGILDALTLRDELARLPLGQSPETTYLVCGPEPMMDAALDTLAAAGVPRARVLEERFVNTLTPGAGEPARLEGKEASLRLTVLAQGSEKSVSLAPGETLLDAAMRGGVVLDYSCATGACGTCMARLVEGSVELDEPHCLSDGERKQGMILPCVSRATSACRIQTL